MPGPQPDHYAVLGVQPSASARQITTAYRRLVRSLHPDTGPARPAAEQELAEVLTAYRVLHDPQSRARYDADRALAERDRRSVQRRGARAGAGRSGPGRPVPTRTRRPQPSADEADTVFVLRLGPVRIELLGVRRTEDDAPATDGLESLEWLVRPLWQRGRQGR
ncbi:J domain-containing protein [Streptomyces endophytica]|uniref:J domain-containing protein n=1 Tax=Streptomyces endophytica TaxID=2991496 RepID=A0ABY6PHW0_9ACTN|nr:J domain-containing protein [Streptomyces endophytica]UZJ33122.1 J domain-containing protein [Streptomyces endophytica]